MSSGDPNDTAARREESVRLRVRSSREIDDDDASLPAGDDESDDANNRQQPPRADSRCFEIPISSLPPPEASSSGAISVSGPDPAEATHPPQLDHGTPITSAATTTRSATEEAADRSSPHRVLGQVVVESDDGFRTPTGTIPLTTECPPAPRKPKSRRRSASALLLQDEIESRRYDLAVEVDAWLEILEEEDRKKRKMARRRAGKSVDV
uniref:Uncharacterized protein n=1 Tax=Kalanchoe fedtschenkoi TaxID=63787 RepID=A0A7N0VC12_KALFE